MNYILSFRDESRNRGGPVLPGRLRRITNSETVDGRLAEDALATEGRIVFLVHGYNVSLKDGKATLLRFAGMLQSVRHLGIVSTLWPGDHWTRYASYSFEGRDADDTGTNFARFIEDTLAPGTSISFVSHSLGARVVLETMKNLSGRHSVDEVCVMAPAVDDSCLAAAETYRGAVEQAGRVAVLSSVEDMVLRLAYPAGDLFQSFIFFHRDQAGLALGYHGPRATDEAALPGNVFHVPIPEKRKAGHADYLPDEIPNHEQKSAARFAGDVISGLVTLRYT